MTRNTKKPNVDELRKRHEEAAQALVEAVAAKFPVGTRCSILRSRNNVQYRIRGEIAVTAWSTYFPTNLGIKTDKRGTMMWAEYMDLEVNR